MYASNMVCTILQENGYSVGGRKPLLFADKPDNARKFMENLAATCRYFKAITAQKSSLFPTLLAKPHTSLPQQWKMSRLFCSLALIESGVPKQQSTTKKDGAKKDENPTYHLMPALVFLTMYSTVSKSKV